MSTSRIQKIVPHLWYSREGGGGRAVLRDRISRLARRRGDVVARRLAERAAGSVDVVEFTLFGQAFMAISAGPHDSFNDAFSLLVNCASQAEIDRYWEALRANGGKPQACGWIIDRYGVRWQISAAALGDMMKTRTARRRGVWPRRCSGR
jgi:predicted 3-demethylubiquinone-9 3-methyltransferase (glyoxalase superfamily)